VGHRFLEAVLSFAAVTIFMTLHGSPDAAAQTRTNRVAQTTGQERSQSVLRRALLVGCSGYQSPIADLPGAANDVKRLRRLLMDKFQFTEDEIIVLSDARGLKNPLHRPTRKNIERELKALATVRFAKEGQAVVYLSGHGGRTRDLDPPGKDEIDGYDEVFCPVDASTTKSGEIANGISDDQIGGYLQNICRQGANVWLIADACHSGTLTRGLPGTLPAGDIARGIGDTGQQARGPSNTGELSEIHETPPGQIISFYAAPPTRKTYDTKFAGVAHGLFTYWICKVLEESRPKQLTYRQLMEQVYANYQKTNRVSPVPQIEGNLKDTLVLGTRKLNSPEIRLSVKGGRYSINAGNLHGARVDSVLAVYPEDNLHLTGNPAGFVRVVRAEPTKAWVEPCRWKFKGRNFDIPGTLDGGPCQIVEHSTKGLRPLAVHLLGHTSLGSPLPTGLQQLWQARVRGLEGNIDAKSAANRLLTVVDNVADADWLIQVVSNNQPERVFILPAEQYRTPTRGELLQKSPEGEEVTSWLRNTFDSIARSRNLLQIAADSMKRQAGPGIEVELRRLRDENDVKGYEKIKVDHDTQLTEGDMVGVWVRNRNPFASFVTLLFVDASHRIWSIFPVDPNNTEHRLEAAGNDGDTKLFHRFAVNASTVGLERFVVLAVKDQPDPPDFTFLGKKILHRPRNDSSPPLERLLAWSVFRDDASRGQTPLGRKQNLDDASIQSVAWRTVAKDKDAVTKGSLFGYFRKGPATDLRAEIVNEQGSVYHTADRTKALLGAYGEILPGNNLLGRAKGFEQHSIVRGVQNVGGKLTVNYSGQVAGADVVALMGKASWQQFTAHGLVDRSTGNSVNFHVAGLRLNTPHVIHLLNHDTDALRHFAYLASEGRQACVVIENIVFPVLKNSRDGRFRVNAAASAAYPPAKASLEVNRHHRTFLEHHGAVVRCYQMHRVKLQNGKVVALDRVAP